MRLAQAHTLRCSRPSGTGPPLCPTQQWEATFRGRARTSRSMTAATKNSQERTFVETNNSSKDSMNAQPTLQIDNEKVVVTEWRFAPGAETGFHVHGHDYVVVPMTSGTLRLEGPDGIRDVELKAGSSYTRLAGVAHNVININSFEFSFIEIELK